MEIIKSSSLQSHCNFHNGLHPKIEVHGFTLAHGLSSVCACKLAACCSSCMPRLIEPPQPSQPSAAAPGSPIASFTAVQAQAPTNLSGHWLHALLGKRRLPRLREGMRLCGATACGAPQACQPPEQSLECAPNLMCSGPRCACMYAANTASLHLEIRGNHAPCPSQPWLSSAMPLAISPGIS